VFFLFYISNIRYNFYLNNNMIISFFRKNEFPFFGKRLWGAILLLCPALLLAQNGVTVTNFVMSAGTVTFDVSWGDKPLPTMWSDSVWVFVDYNDRGVMRRLALTDATLIAPSAPDVGEVIKVPGNNSGVWVVGNARSAGSCSATVQLFASPFDVAGACAYASNYPPEGEFISITDVKFTGTPMYEIVLKHTDGHTETRRSDDLFTIPSGYALHSFNDATGAPGTIKCIPPVVTLHPQSQVFCKAASVITLGVTALGSGNTLSYQWKTGAGEGTDVGTGSSTYTGTMSASADYWVVVTDDKNCSTISEKAAITIFSSGMIGMKGICGDGAGKIGW
jgi:hypothetical protein